MPVYNEKQKEAVKEIKKFMADPDARVFYLFGYAGTGKTYLMSNVVARIATDRPHSKMSVSAPTHKALDVIRSYMHASVPKETYEKLAFTTLHRMLGMLPIIMCDDGARVFVNKSTAKKEFDIIVIDECSMIPKRMADDLNRHMKDFKVKIFFMGDRMQLPPINETESKVFVRADMALEYHINLDEIMRTHSAEIKDVCCIIRNWDPSQSLNVQLLDIHNIDKPNSEKTFKMYHKKRDYKKTSWFKYTIKQIEAGHTPVILSWRNETAKFYNNVIRKHIHQTEVLDEYIIGDLLMFGDYYVSQESSIKFHTSDKIIVLDIEESDKLLCDWNEHAVTSSNAIKIAYNTLLKKFSKLEKMMRVVLLEVACLPERPEDTGKIIVQTIHCADVSSYLLRRKNIHTHITDFYTKHKSKIITKMLWDLYYKHYVDPYAELNFGHSITTHKAQGSTYDHVLVDADDIRDNNNLEEMKRAMYTAASRASEFLALIV